MVKMLKKYERSIAILLIAFLAIPLNLFTSLATVLAEDGGDSVGENVVIHHDFESDDTHGWAPLGWGDGAKIVITDEEAAHGEQSLKFYDREGVNSSLSLNLIDKLEKGQTYDISFDVKMSEGTSTLRLASVYKYPNTSNETPWLIGNKDVGPDEWVSFELSDFEYHEETSEFIVYIETDDSGSDADFYLDNFKVIQHEDIEVPEEPFEPVEVLSFDFEADSTEGWFNLNWDGMGPAEIKTTDEAFSTGEQSLGYLNRPSDLESRLSYNLGDDLTPGEIYTISFDVKLKEGNDNFVFAAKYTSPAQSNEYPWLSGEIAVGSDDWTSYTLENFEYDHNSTELIVFLQTQSTKNDFYLDNFKVMHVGSLEEPEEEDLEKIPEDERVAIFTDFEDGTTQGWERRNGHEELSIADIGANDSSHSLLVENRQSSSDAAIIEFLEDMRPGYEYAISLYVRLAEGEADTPLQLSAAQTIDGTTSYYPPIIAPTMATSDEWVKLEGTYAVPRNIEALSFYVEEEYDADSTSGVSYYIDDFRAEVFIPDYPVQTYLTPLKDIYEDMFLIGNAVESVHFNGRTLDLLRHHHNLVTAENIMKPENYYSGGEFTHSRQDQWLQNAVDNDMLIHGHVLLWHSQSEESLYRNPDGSYKTRAEALANMHEHIENVMRTADEVAEDHIISWDVVNEALAGNWSNPEDWKAQLRSTPDVGWLHSVGDDYIYEAFKHARKVADELGRHDMILYYNDYNDHVQGKARTMYHMIKDINEQYASDPDNNYPDRPLISGVGMQAHYTTTVNIANVRESLERFIDLGIEIGVTELDVGASEGTTLTDRENREQAYFYAQLFDLYREHSDHMSRVTFWGLSDGNSWRSATSPLLFDRNLQAKTAYYAVADPETYLAENDDPGQVIARQGNAAYGTPVIDGEIDDIWNQAPVLPINRFQTAHNGATGEARVLWDNENLYVLVEVNDNELDKSASDAHEQDSVEVFIDEQNTKAASYGDGHAQYRVNFDNEQSFNGDVSERFDSETVVNGTNYLVEMRIPFKTTTLGAGQKIGFDVQINDAVNGGRNSVAIWSDVNTGMGWSDPSVFGELTLNEGNEVIIEEGEETVIRPEQKVVVKSDGKEVSIKTPTNLPAGTKVTINFVDPTTLAEPKTESGEILEVAGEIVQVDLAYPEGYEDFEGEFELTLTYNKDDYQWVSAFYYNEDEGVWERRTGGIIDRDKGEIRLTVSGFSTYGVFEVGAEEVIEDLEEVIRNLTDRVNELDENATGLEELIEALRGEIEDLRASEQSLSDILEELLAKLQELEDRIAKLEGGGNETPGEDGETPGTGDGEADEDSGPVLVDPDETDDESDDSTEKPAEKDKDGNALPATATSLFNYMLIGALVLLVGAGLALYSYKRKRA